MKPSVPVVGSLILLCIAGFCLFGFLATFEPTSNATQFMVYRIVYGLIGLGCLFSVGVLITNVIRK